MYADVIVDIATSDLDRIFEYFLPDSTVKEGFRVLVPFGNKFSEGIVVGLKDKPVYPVEKIKSVLRKLEDFPVLSKECLDLANYVSERFSCSKAAALRLFLPAEMRKGRIKEKKERYFSLDKEDLETEIKKSAVKQIEAYKYLKENGEEKAAILNEKFGTSALNSLLKKGIIKESFKSVFRKPYGEMPSEKKEINLTGEQENAIKSVIETEKSVTLIHGVTGSGKTEVYLRLIDTYLKKGKTAILLVPEISLTPQMLKALRERFKDECAILHSGLSAGERFDEWLRLKKGQAKIAVGARSAIFAPIENIGIIIIDEQHDGSYVSESVPRYKTEDIAFKRAEYYGAKVVLGSATPSVETYYHAISGEYNLVKMNNRVNKKELPKISIVDMRREVRKGNNSPFSALLKTELAETLKNGNQAIIFLNQRGFSKNVICSECGYVPKCENCDVSLTYHMEDHALKCHYCDAKYKMIETCPECGSKFLRYGSFGTQRVVYELNKLFPDAKIGRMDKDTTQNKEGHYKIISAFAKKEYDILVGTQMIAKGHDFPSVTLVGVLDADSSLFFSDYKSGEKTFELITQVAGRSGRANETGKVVVQSFQPDNNVLNYAVKYDYQGFYKNEISLRKATGFPPFADIIRIMVSGEDDAITRETLKNVYNDVSIIYKTYQKSFVFFGCMKSPIKKIQKKFRYQILMRTAKREVYSILCKIAAKYDTGKVSVYAEENPNNLV